MQGHVTWIDLADLWHPHRKYAQVRRTSLIHMIQYVVSVVWLASSWPWFDRHLFQGTLSPAAALTLCPANRDEHVLSMVWDTRLVSATPILPIIGAAMLLYPATDLVCHRCAAICHAQGSLPSLPLHFTLLSLLPRSDFSPDNVHYIHCTELPEITSSVCTAAGCSYEDSPDAQPIWAQCYGVPWYPLPDKLWVLMLRVPLGFVFFDCDL